MSGWELDVDGGSYRRWVIQADPGQYLMVFHNHSEEYRDSFGFVEWSWCFDGGEEQPTPDTCTTLEERQAWAMAAWRTL